MWVKLDDSFAEHPKILALSDAAFRLHVRALCYCGRYLTDGLIPRSFVGGSRAWRELLAAGLWDTHAEGGWQIHDWLDYQPTRDAVTQRRETDRERMEKW